VMWSNTSADLVEHLSTYFSPLGPRQRSLILWDEALLSSQHASVHWPVFEAQLGALSRLAHLPESDYAELQPIVVYLEQCSRMLREERQRSAEIGEGDEAHVFKLPFLTSGVRQQAWQKLRTLGVNTDELVSLLEQHNRPARFVSAASGVVT